MKDGPGNLARKGLICAGLGFITLAVYWPIRAHEFLLYDDQLYVTGNPHIQRGLTWSGVAWAFQTFYAGNWHPLTWMSHMLDCQWFHLQPAGHHLTSLLLHTANSLLLFLVLSRLTGALWRSALVAALFAWHPLHVESVAWISERKDVSSTFFALLSVWAYAGYVTRVEGRVSTLRSAATEDGSHVRNGTRTTEHDSQFTIHHSPWYFLSLFLFALALLSKPMLVTLPFLLLLLDFWPLGRFRSTITEHGTRNTEHADRLTPPLRLLFEKLPFLALSLASSVVTIFAQQRAYSIVSAAALPVARRILHAAVAYGHYLGATFVPWPLAVCYPYEAAIPAREVILALAALALITWIAFRLALGQGYLFVGWLWFLGTLVPVIGLVQVGDQAWADRYTYLPLVGLFIMLVWGGFDLAQRALGNTTARTIVAAAVAVATGLALCAAASVQLGYWKNTRQLFEHAARVTPKNARALAVLGGLLAAEGKADQAMDYYRQALACNPDQPEAHFSMGRLLEKQGKLDEAIAQYQQVLWFKPLREQTHILIGMAFARQTNYAGAAAQYAAALAFNPKSAPALNNLARLLHTQGRTDEAVQTYCRALAFDPDLAEAHNNLGVLLLQKGRVDEGVAQLRESLRLRPGDPETRYNLALGLNQQQHWEEAAQLFSQIAPARPQDANLYSEFALALTHLGRTREAMSRYAQALLVQRDLPSALDRLAWILATDPDANLRDATEAVRMAERACELTGRKDAEKLKTLAAAYAEAARFPEAVQTAQQARVMAASGGQKGLAAECETMLEGFKEGRPRRQAR